MDPEYWVAQSLANEARRVKTWVEVEKARLTGSGLSDDTKASPDSSKEAPDQLR